MHVEEWPGSKRVHGLVSLGDCFAHSHADLQQRGLDLFWERTLIGQLLDEGRVEGLMRDRGIVVRGNGEELLGLEPSALVQGSIGGDLRG